MATLRERAPVTAASIRPPRSVSEREAAERATTPWTEELREFYGLHDGQHETYGEEYVPAGSVLPDFTLYSLDRAVDRHRFSLENPHPIDDLGEDWPAEVLAQEAGETAEMFVPAYVPFAEDGSGGTLYIDTRPGARRGCIRSFSYDSADQGAPWFDSLAEFVAALQRCTAASRRDLRSTTTWRPRSWTACSNGATPRSRRGRWPTPLLFPSFEYLSRSSIFGHPSYRTTTI